jgi:hypothetical protein
MCLVEDVLWKRASPKPFRQIKALALPIDPKRPKGLLLFETSPWRKHPVVLNPGEGKCKTWWSMSG